MPRFSRRWRNLEALAELLRGDLSGIARDHHAAEEKAEALEVVDELERVVRVGDAEVGAHLLVLDVASVDAENDLRLVAERLQQAQLHVRIVAWQTARGVHVVHQLAAELQVELAKLRRPAADLVALPYFAARRRISSLCSVRYFSLSKPIFISRPR